jgi:hypothetical protein
MNVKYIHKNNKQRQAKCILSKREKLQHENEFYVFGEG